MFVMVYPKRPRAELEVTGNPILTACHNSPDLDSQGTIKSANTFDLIQYDHYSHPWLLMPHWRARNAERLTLER